MERVVGDVTVHYVEHGDGAPVLVLHGAGVDHREAAACFEPALGARDGFRRIYPDLQALAAARRKREAEYDGPERRQVDQPYQGANRRAA